MIELEKEDAAVGEFADLIALVQGILQRFAVETGQHDLTVLEQVEQRPGLGGYIGHLDAVESDTVAIPVVLVLLQPQ